jgi:hypothetical protein
MTKRKLLHALACACALLLFSACEKDNENGKESSTGPDLVFYGVTASNQLLQYNAKSPGTIDATVAITGLQTGETLLGIDFRPATGQLYGIGSTSRIYIINHLTGKATAVGTGPFTPAISGNLVAFDFNPTVDRIRLVTSAGQNLRLNPETGAVAATDGNINPSTAAVSAVAYTNNFAGATSTTLYDIDITTGKLFKQDPPNNGALVEVGSLNIGAFTDGGFDISPDNDAALASLTVSGSNKLFLVDLTTGKATDLGAFATPITGIAIPTNSVAYSVDASNNLMVHDFMASGIPVSKPITGLQAGEMIVGLDFRPANGQLYALGSTSRLYSINTASAAATAVGAQFSTLLNGTSFGFDFNPTVDRIRVVSNSGQNLRLDPNTGAVAAVDGTLNPGTPMVSAGAYINNFPGATATTLYVIDANTDKLYIQNPPNNGTLVEVGALGIDVELSNGFDIGGTSNKAYALLRVGGSTKMYSINLTTGAAAMFSEFPSNVTGLAIGLGF